MIRVFCALASVILGLGWASATLAVPAVTVVSITPVSSGPSRASENFTVVFSENVTGVGPHDFHPTTTGTVTGNVDGVTGSVDTYIVTVGGITGEGTLRLDLKNSGTNIVGVSGPIVGGYTGGGVRTITSAAAPVSVPTLSEWAMILFAALVAGGGALYLQRRRPAV